MTRQFLNVKMFFQTLSGVRLKDTSLMRTYPFDDLCHVYVTAEEMKIEVMEDFSR